MAQHASTMKGSQQLFDLLKKDHRQAEKLMQQISSTAHDRREELFFELRRELTEHMQMEEKEFYPKLQKVAEMEDQVEDAMDSVEGVLGKPAEKGARAVGRKAFEVAEHVVEGSGTGE